MARLGKKSDDTFRPLLVNLESVDVKHAILANSPRLRSMEWYTDVFISPDLTKAERKKQKELMVELKRRREAGIVIRGGGIVAINKRSKKSENFVSATDQPPVSSGNDVQSMDCLSAGSDNNSYS